MDVVEDGVTGRLVTPGERAPLAAANEGLLRDPAEAARLGRQGRERMLDTFAPDAVAERYLDVYAAARAATVAMHAG